MRTRQWKSPSKHPQSPTFSNVPKFDPGRCWKTEKGPISVNAACATLVFDGECAICRSWVSYWQRLTNGRVIYRPYQEAAADFPTIAHEAFERAIWLIEPDGQIYSGAARPRFRCSGVRRPIFAVNCKSWQRRCPLAVP